MQSNYVNIFNIICSRAIIIRRITTASESTDTRTVLLPFVQPEAIISFKIEYQPATLIVHKVNEMFFFCHLLVVVLFTLVTGPRSVHTIVEARIINKGANLRDRVAIAKITRRYKLTRTKYKDLTFNIDFVKVRKIQSVVLFYFTKYLEIYLKLY